MTSMLDADEVARRLNVSLATAYREMKKMLHVVIGTRAIRVSETAFEAYLRRRALPATDEPTDAAQLPKPLSGPIRRVQPRRKRGTEVLPFPAGDRAEPERDPKSASGAILEAGCEG